MLEGFPRSRSFQPIILAYIVRYQRMKRRRPFLSSPFPFSFPIPPFRRRPRPWARFFFPPDKSFPILNLTFICRVSPFSCFGSFLGWCLRVPRIYRFPGFLDFGNLSILSSPV